MICLYGLGSLCLHRCRTHTGYSWRSFLQSRSLGNDEHVIRPTSKYFNCSISRKRSTSERDSSGGGGGRGKGGKGDVDGWSETRRLVLIYRPEKTGRRVTDCARSKVLLQRGNTDKQGLCNCTSRNLCVMMFYCYLSFVFCFTIIGNITVLEFLHAKLLLSQFLIK